MSAPLLSLLLVLGCNSAYGLTSSVRTSGRGTTCPTLQYETGMSGPNAIEPGIPNVTSPEACCALCEQFYNCTGFTWVNNSAGTYQNYCSLKLYGALHFTSQQVGAVSAFRERSPDDTPGVFMKGKAKFSQSVAWDVVS